MRAVAPHFEPVLHFPRVSGVACRLAHLRIQGEGLCYAELYCAVLAATLPYLTYDPVARFAAEGSACGSRAPHTHAFLVHIGQHAPDN
ncbi:hypothetical protein M8818_003355 [Zalaria obscura]|uniref:Uncharacterized protein n=1 Tax=Zalaria obscura TaxID=2024903 RepID=A0ACC3SEV7_9PEZI